MQPPTSTQPQATMPQGAIAVSGLSLRHNFAWTLAGNVVYAGCQWGMLIVLAKLGSPIMVGQFALGLAVCAPIVLFTNLSMRNIQATDARGEYLFGHYYCLRLITTAFALLIIAGITFWTGYPWETKLVILSIGLAKAFESISDVFYGLFQRYERMDRIALSMMIKGPFSLLALGLGVFLTGSVFWGSIALAAVWALVLLVFDLKSVRSILHAFVPNPTSEPRSRCKLNLCTPLWDAKNLSRLAWLAFPLGLVAMLISLNTNIPRYFIEHYLGEEQLASFAAMAYFLVAGDLIVNALGQSATPQLSKYYILGNSSACRALLFRLLGLSAFLGLLGIIMVPVAGYQILSFLYRPEYAQNLDVFSLLMIGALLSYLESPLNYILIAMRQFFLQLTINFIKITMILFMSYILIRSKGMYGIALAIIISSGISFLLKLGLTSIHLSFFQRNQ